MMILLFNTSETKAWYGLGMEFSSMAVYMLGMADQDEYFVNNQPC